MHVLGIWDGHDAGAALVDENKVVYAANEERFTKRKLEINFPRNSILAALDYAELKPDEIKHIAFTTTEFTKTLERLFPSMKESYYQFRRRKIPKPSFDDFRHKLKYSITTIGILPFCGAISSQVISRQLRGMGFKDFKLHIVEHHTAHAATAAFTSRLKNPLVITLDGLGDGLSGSISLLENGKLERQVSIGASDSLGILFEQVTNLVGMRELEDEGKVMAMADYSYPFPYEQNKLKDFITVEKTNMKAKYSPSAQYSELQKLGWQMPREQFSYMAQQLLEHSMIKFVSNAIDELGANEVAFAGGVFSNVKANMGIRKLSEVKHWHVFPHMGDGGIALGAALYVQHLLTGKTNFEFSAYLGNEYSTEETKKLLEKEKGLNYEEESSAEQTSHAADLISGGNYLFWFQGRMEYGPRALGNRSILAPTDSEAVKEKLNLQVKRREWFQPFAPSMLEGEEKRILYHDGKGTDKFMTMAYSVRENFREHAKSVVHVDMTARPQLVGDENKLYADLLGKIKKKKGYGMVLNTSFNLHGSPIVMDPQNAIKTMKETRTPYMFINGLFVTNKQGIR